MRVLQNRRLRFMDGRTFENLDIIANVPVLSGACGVSNGSLQNGLFDTG